MKKLFQYLKLVTASVVLAKVIVELVRAILGM